MKISANCIPNKKGIVYSLTISAVVITLLLVNFVDCQRGRNRGRGRSGNPDNQRLPDKIVKNVTISNVCQTGSCQIPGVCFSLLVEADVVAVCKLRDGSNGVCCPIVDESQNDAGIRPPPRRPPHRGNTITISIEEINTAGDIAIKWVREMERLEVELKQKKLLAKRGGHESRHQNFFGSNPIAGKLGRDGMVALQTALSIAKQKKLSLNQTRSALPTIDLSNSVLQDLCPKEASCPTSKYRTADGTCNNRNNKSWGKAMIAFSRILNPEYSDGVNEPRVASDGSALPSARQVSVILAPDRNEQSRRYTLFVMQFGQFLDHDLDRTASTRTTDNSAIQCCGEQFEQNPQLLHPACMAITIPRDDRFFSRQGQTCMNFVRSAAAPREECKLGPREQLNQISSYIDAGNIYGSTDQEAANLRSFRGGKLRTSVVNNREFLPFANSTICSLPDNSEMRCFAAGDGRINEQVDLTVMHALWLREHNRIADELSKINPGWNDEILYQETRRIVAAELQHITYNEFLPSIIGQQAMRLFANLPLRQDGYSNSYSPDINAGITSVFATAAYRFHTLIPGAYDLHNNNNRIVDRFELSNNFDNPQILYREGAFDALVNGLAAQPVQRGDNFFSTAVTEHLFQPAGQQFGMDLISLNIQRGRDHGLPGYNAWREVCGLRRARNFRDLESIMNRNVVRAMSRIYSNVNDIDLFIGGASETAVRGALVGPTFACLIAEQFRRIKNGDRFWYENGGLDSSFTEQQLSEIRKTSLARIVCDNSDSIASVQPLAMVQPSNWNPKVRCNNENVIPRINLRHWRNEPNRS